jgi:ATP-binding cassette subfamily F protein uup
VPVLSARHLSKAFGPQTLFSDVSITIVRGEHVGLLGVNGTGKSTLLSVLAGKEPADAGTIDRRRDATIGWLEQEPALDGAKTPREIACEGLAEWQDARARHRAISERIERGETDSVVVAEQSALAERVERLGGWSRDHVAEEILEKLGVRDLDRAVSTMSGGERRRVALARILVARPMLAILDEPTNHLDVETIEWLEDFLVNEFGGAVLMVTHDRWVLDSICDRIVELDRGTLVEYRGAYREYLEQKLERAAHEERTEQNRLNLLRRETAWLARGAQARSTKQKARIQRAEALVRAEPLAQASRVDLSGMNAGGAELGKSVLDFENVDLAIGEKILVRDLSLHLVRSDRIGVIGRNGVGKTSLLRAITGDLAPSKGTITVGARTDVALFDQARAELRDDWTVLENIAEREDAARTGAGVVTIGKETIETRTYLERFLFDASKQRQSVGSLSGGERARVALAKILKSGKNLLLLDEPTNDLDTATLAALEDLLESWSGCVVAVSHDRYFLDRVATSMLVFEGDGKVTRYPGNYSTWVSLRPARADSAASAPKKVAPDTKSASTAPQTKKLTYAERIELDGILDVIAAAEARVARAEASLADPAFYASKEDATRIASELDAARAEVASLLARWESLEARRS